jgi:iron complex outermembrane receptor protein
VNSRLSLAFAMSSSALAAAVPALAQRAPASDQIATSVQEVVVTAEKREERLVNVPGAVSAVSSKQISQLDAHSLADIAALVPGLNVSSQGGTGNVVLRGINTGTLGAAPLVGIIVDGAPYGSSTAYGNAGVFPLDLDLSQVDRVEVLPGPQSTLYGANAMGGLISYVLKSSIPHRLGAALDLQGSVADIGRGSYRASGDVDMPIIEDKAGLRVSGFYDHEGGFLNDKQTGQTDVNASTSKGGMANLTLKPASNVTVNLTALLQSTDRNSIDAVGYNYTTGRPLVGPDDIGHPELEPVTQNYQQYTGHIDWNLGPVDLTSITSWSRTANGTANDLSLSPLFMTVFPLGGWSKGDVASAATTDKITEEFRAASTNTQGVTWLTGLFFNHEATRDVGTVRGQGARGAPLIPGVNNPLLVIDTPSALTEYAAFGNVTVPITSRLQVTGGLRITRDDQDHQQLTSGSLQPLFGFPAATPVVPGSATHLDYLASIRYALAPSTNIYARVATGFRPGGPNIAQVGVPSTFNPDSLTNYEVGLKSNFWGGRASVDVDAFYIDWSNIQLLSQATFVYYVNGKSATSEGVEFTGTVVPVDGLTLTGTFAYTDAYLNAAVPLLGAAAGEPLTNTPKFSGSLIGEYRRPIAEDWVGVMGGRYSYVGDRTSSYNGSTTVPQFILRSYSMIDLHVGVEHDRYRLTVFVHNAGNVAGQVSAYSAYGYSDVGVTRPREVGVELSASF